MQWGLGLYTAQVPNDAEHDVRRELGRIIEQAQLAELVGLDAIWLSEHHGTDDGYLPSLATVAAAVLASTERIIVGTAVMLAPFHHPLRLAEDVAVLDQLSGGRFILGLGTGWRSAEFSGFGLDPRQRVPMLEETVAVLRKAWSGERFDHQGVKHKFEGAIVRPRPLTPGGPPIWLGGTGPRALARAGRIGDGLFSPGLPFDQAMSAYQRALDATPDDRRDTFAFGQMRSGFIAGCADEAWALAGRGMTYTLQVHQAWAAQDAGSDVEHAGITVDPQAVRSYNLLGSPADMISALTPYAAAFGERHDCHHCMRLYHPYTPYDSVLAAIEAHGRVVVPALREHSTGAER